MKTFIKKRSQKKKRIQNQFLKIEDYLVFKEKLKSILDDFSDLSIAQEQTNAFLFGQIKEITFLNNITEDQIKSFK